MTIHSPSLLGLWLPSVIREMQVKTSLRYHFAPTRMARTERTVPGVGEEMELLECVSYMWGCKEVLGLCKIVWLFFRMGSGEKAE